MKFWLAGLCLAHALDMTSTQIAVSRGAEELNPVLSGGGGVAIHASLAGVESVALVQLAKTHPTRAKVLAVIAIAVEGSAVAWNLHVAQQQKGGR